MSGPPGYARKSLRTVTPGAGSVASFGDGRRTLDAAAEADHYLRLFGARAADILEIEAGARRFRHHVLRVAAEIVRARLRSGGDRRG